MNTRRFLIVGFVTIAVVALAIVGTQQRSRAALQREIAVREAARAAALRDGGALAADFRTPTNAALTSAERVELMRLRSLVTELRDRQRSLSRLTGQTALLQARWSILSNAVEGRFPAGFMERRHARNVGAATPEAALETLLWSIEHQDTNGLISILPIERHDQVMGEFEQRGVEDFFKGFRVLTGLRIVERLDHGSESVGLRVEIGYMPEPDDSNVFEMKREQGSWKFAGF